MAPRDDIDARIDDLYQLPLNEFTSARNALVKTLRGADASRVRKLAKPSVVAWAVNQVYWKSRAVYERVMKTGEQLRTAQIAALEGKKKADVRATGDAHRRAIGDAVQEAQRLAAPSGSHPGPDALMRTFEALSLSTEAPEPGRLTEPLQPAGFEALAGVTPKSPTHQLAKSPTLTSHASHERGDKQRERESKEHQREEKQRRAAIAKAQAALERAKSAEALARETLARAERDVRAAEEHLARLQSSS